MYGIKHPVPDTSNHAIVVESTARHKDHVPQQRSERRAKEAALEWQLLLLLLLAPRAPD